LTSSAEAVIPAPRRPGRLDAAAAGVAAGAIALAVEELLARVVGPLPSLVVAVASRVVDRAPGSVRSRAIEQLGTADKPVLVVTVVAAALVSAAAINDEIWRQWRLTWVATRGAHRLRVRATDGFGRRQPEDYTRSLPSGATGAHVVRVDIA
jgi:hypothetical protein